MHFDYKINMWAAGGLVRCRSGRRGVGNGRRRREREREERKCRQRVGAASGMARERERRMELASGASSGRRGASGEVPG